MIWGSILNHDLLDLLDHHDFFGCILFRVESNQLIEPLQKRRQKTAIS